MRHLYIFFSEIIEPYIHFDKKTTAISLMVINS